MNVHDNHKCEEMLIKLSDYMNGELDDKICSELKAHLAECKDCSCVLASLEKTIALCKENAKENISQELMRKIKSNIKSYKILN